MRQQEPTRRRAGGSILPHEPGKWHTADGQVHSPAGVSGLRYGRATPVRGGAGAGGGREPSTWRPAAVPSPRPAWLPSVVQSPPPPGLARPGLIVREAATARGLPHPGTARGGPAGGRSDVGKRGGGRDFRRAGPGSRAGPGHVGGGQHRIRPPEPPGVLSGRVSPAARRTGQEA